MSHAELKNKELARRIFTAEHFGDGLLHHDHYEAARTLRRAQLTLHRWAELECGTDAGYIEEVPAGSGKYTYKPSGSDQGVSCRIPNRERGALARIAKVCKECGLFFYHQTDPRGCALYVSAEPLNSQNYSSRGIACL